jgi:hypothetical protein
MKHSKFSSHFSIAEGRKPHPLRQVMPRPWGSDDGVTLLRALGLQKDELLKMFSSLPLKHLLSLMLCDKLVLKKGDLTGKAFGIFMSRG